MTGVTFDNSPAHFVDSAALLTISFDGTSDDENVIAAMNEIRSLTAGFDTYTSSDIGADLLGEIAQQMEEFLRKMCIRDSACCHWKRHSV